MSEREPSNQTNESQRWQAVVNHTSGPDQLFVYAVVTTGIYCQPGCRSRRPRRENVRFFDTWQAAEAAGFRACKRCTPRQADASPPHLQAVTQACRMIEASLEPPSLEALAAEANLSPHYFHRVFKQIVGITPYQYYQQTRQERVRENLQQEEKVSEVIYQSGYQASSRFYAQSGTVLGMAPAAYQQGGKGMHIRWAAAQSYLGWVLVAATNRGICAIEFGDGPDELARVLQKRFPQATCEQAGEAFAGQVAAVLAFLQAPRQGLDLPLDIQGTAFQQRVWQALREIPAGESVSYRELARRIGNPQAARAVAQACAQNRLAVAVPCHRVVRADGSLGGYRWGLARKRQLLDREAQAG